MKSFKGHFLIAATALEDPNFNRTVVLMVQHDSEGALGLVLNRPLEMTLRELWEQLSTEPCNIDQPLHQGGPCDGPLMALHAHAEAAEMTLMPGVHFSDESESIQWLVAHGSSPLRFFAGYSGWSPGQLEDELKQGAWLTTPADASTLFAPPDKLWPLLQLALSPASTLLGMNPMNLPDDPSMN